MSTSVFFSKLADYLEPFLLYKEQILVAGDFNIHINVAGDPGAVKLLDLLESVGLQQHVTQPTHIHGHVLDLIITRRSDHTLRAPPIVDRFVSDHASLLCKLLPSKPPVTVRVITFRKHKSIDMESFKNDLAASTFCRDYPAGLAETSPDVDKLVMEYNNTLYPS